MVLALPEGRPVTAAVPAGRGQVHQDAARCDSRPGRPAGERAAGMTRIRPLAAAGIAAVLVCGASGGFPAAAASLSQGAGMGPWPACSSMPLQPGHSGQLTSGGWAGAGGTAAAAGIKVTNTGTDTETLSFSVQGPWRGQDLGRLGRPVPPGWVTFSRPSVSLGPGQNGWSTVTVTVPPGTPDGTYVGNLVATTTAADGVGGGASPGAAAQTPIGFTVGLAKPPWPLQILGGWDPCWALPGQKEPWAQWSRLADPNPPPGWFWGTEPGPGSPPGWIYQPPPGWYWDWSDPVNAHLAYEGGRPTRLCIPESEIRAHGWSSGAPGGVPWVGGGDVNGHPDTSDAAGCRAWLKASADGTLNVLAFGKQPRAARAQPTSSAAAQPAAYTPAAQGQSKVAGWVALFAIAAALFVAWRLSRRWRRGRR
jgi:hypothetical protein